MKVKLTVKQRDYLSRLPEFDSASDLYWRKRFMDHIRVDPDERKETINQLIKLAKLVKKPDGAYDWDDAFETPKEYDLGKFESYLKPALGVMSDHKRLHACLLNLYFEYYPEELQELEKQTKE